MFEAEILYISGFTKGRKGGFYRIVVLKTLGTDSVKGKVYLLPENRNYIQWEPLLTVGNVLQNLVWKDSKPAIIDADSPVETVESHLA